MYAYFLSSVSCTVLSRYKTDTSLATVLQDNLGKPASGWQTILDFNKTRDDWVVIASKCSFAFALHCTQRGIHYSFIL